MQSRLSFISFLVLTAGYNAITASAQQTNSDFDIELPSTIKAVIYKKINKADTITPALLKPYSNIKYEKKELLSAAPGTKSVLFNNNGSKLYAMNLEGMSIAEFDQPTRKILRNFKFKPTKGQGWDYETDKPISSYEEKPVEACLSHNDKILWVSLHNAEGIVPIRIDSISFGAKCARGGRFYLVGIVIDAIPAGRSGPPGSSRCRGADGSSGRDRASGHR